MATNSKIEWTHHTANLWWGCSAVHAGCDNCYAEALAKRYGHQIWGNDTPRALVKSVWKDLDRYQVDAQKAGEIHRVFVGSMMDIFEKDMPLVDFKHAPVIIDGFQMRTGQLRQELFERISRGRYPNLMLLLLTKRPSNINKMIPEQWKINPPSNVMFGTSPVDQQTFDNLVQHLLKVNGRRFLSIEPQLGDIALGHLTGIDWIIQGGESGSGRRPFSLEWAKSMRQQCAQVGVPYFFKQIDKVRPIPEGCLVREFPAMN